MALGLVPWTEDPEPKGIGRFPTQETASRTSDRSGHGPEDVPEVALQTTRFGLEVRVEVGLVHHSCL